MDEEQVKEPLSVRIKHWLLHGLRDWLALNSVGFFLGVLLIAGEIKILGITLAQFGLIRVIYVPMINIAVFAGAWSWTSARIAKGLQGWNSRVLKSFVVEGSAISLVRIPLYTFALVVVGLPVSKIALSAVYNTLGNFAIGWLNGLIRDWLKSHFMFFNGDTRGVG